MMSELSTILLREIPPVLIKGVQSGELAVHGSVIRSLSTGQIVAHLQETSGLGSLASKLLMPGGLPLQVAQVATGAVGDGLILEQGRRIKAAVDLVSQLQLANLIVSGATLGVSVAGFAFLSARIKRLEHQLSAMDRALADLRASVEAMREDRISEDFSWLRTALQQLEESWSLRHAGTQLERVASDTHLLANRFFDRAKAVLESEGPRLSQAAPFIEAVGLAQSARVTARLAAEEDAAARLAAAEGLEHYEHLLELVDATGDALAVVDKDDAGSNEWVLRLEAKMAANQVVASAARLRAETMAATDELLISIADKGLSGREWLLAAREEQDAPLLVMQLES